MKTRIIIVVIYVFGFIDILSGQDKIVPIPFGDFEQWITRKIKESNILGGNNTLVYAIGPQKTIEGAIPYDSRGVSPWGCSNVLAVVKGVTKTSTTAFPEKRDDGYCVRLDTKLVKCEVMNLFKISVLASGTVYLGRVIEPVKSTNNPYANIDMGIPFNLKPKALELDYKTKLNTDRIITKAGGMSIKKYTGDDYPDVFIYLQKRWEDEKGNIFAKRVGTARKFFDISSDEWVNDYRLNIYYGDISKESYFKPYMDLRSEFYAENSKGKMVKVTEIGWGDINDDPTHVILFMSSGCKGAYEGALDNSFWIDNVKFVY